MEVNGLAHLILVARDWERTRAFYRELLPFLGLRPVMDTDQFLYCVGGRTAVGVRPCDPEHADRPWIQNAPGMHHYCFRARTREDVDAVAAKLAEMGVETVHPAEEGSWAPGYYSVLFEDPDGMRVEVNFVPGRGLLAE